MFYLNRSPLSYKLTALKKYIPTTMAINFLLLLLSLKFKMLIDGAQPKAYSFCYIHFLSGAHNEPAFQYTCSCTLIL